MSEMPSSHRGAERARNAAVATPFWLDAFLVVCVAHLCHMASRDPFVAAMLWHSLGTRDGWLYFVLPPYFLLLGLGAIWKRKRRWILYLGGVGVYVGLNLCIAEIAY